MITTSTISGVEITRKIYVPGSDGFARWLNIVRNTSGLNANVNLTMLSNLGSDARTKIWSTSNGDKLATVQDSWITSYEDFVNGSSRAPRLAHVLQSPNAVIPVSALTFADGNDQPTWSYAFSLAPGHTAVIWNFAAGLANRARTRRRRPRSSPRCRRRATGLHDRRRARGAVERRRRASCRRVPNPPGRARMQITLSDHRGELRRLDAVRLARRHRPDRRA